MTDNAIPPIEYYHDLHCSAMRSKPMGCSGCSCKMYQRARKAEAQDKFKYWVVYNSGETFTNDDGSYSSRYTAKFDNKGHAINHAQYLAQQFIGTTIYLEDHDKETVEEIVCEINTIGRFPLNEAVRP